MSEIRTSRQFIVDFLEKNRELMGDIQTVMVSEDRTIDLNNMTDDEATEVAGMFMLLGTPSRLGSLLKGK